MPSVAMLLWQRVNQGAQSTPSINLDAPILHRIKYHRSPWSFYNRDSCTSIIHAPPHANKLFFSLKLVSRSLAV